MKYNALVTYQATNAIVHLISADWQSLPEGMKPWGVWIRHYPPIAQKVQPIDSARYPLQAWFLDAEGLHERSILDWRRFAVVQFEQPWCSKMWSREKVAVFGPRHEIGLAAFATYIDSEDYYVETIYGNLYGMGWRVQVSASGAINHRKSIWLS